MKGQIGRNYIEGLNYDGNDNVPIWEKSNLTLNEASKYFGIGINKLRSITDEKDCGYVLWCGSKRLIKRKKLEEYLSKTYSI